MRSPISDDPHRKRILQIARSILLEVDRQQLGKPPTGPSPLFELPAGAPFLRRMTERHRREGRPTQELIAMTRAVTIAVQKAIEAGESPEITLETIAALHDCFQKDLVTPEMTLNPVKLRAMVSQLAGGDNALVELALNIRELYPGLEIPLICFPSTQPKEGHSLTVRECYRMPVQHESFYMGVPYAGPLLYPLIGLSQRVPKHPGDFRTWLSEAHKSERPLVIIAPFYFEFVEHFAKDLSEVLSQPVCLLTPNLNHKKKTEFLEDLAVYLGCGIWYPDAENEGTQVPKLGTAQALAFDRDQALFLQGGGPGWQVTARKFRLAHTKAEDRHKALSSQSLVFTPGGSTPNAPIVACGRIREVIHFLRAYDASDLTYGWPKIFSKAIQDLSIKSPQRKPDTPIMTYLKQWVTPQANTPRLDLLTSVPNMRLSIDLATEIAFRTLAQSRTDQDPSSRSGPADFDPYRYIESVKGQVEPEPHGPMPITTKSSNESLWTGSGRGRDLLWEDSQEAPFDAPGGLEDPFDLSDNFEEAIGNGLLDDSDQPLIDLSDEKIDFDEYLDFEEDDLEEAPTEKSFTGSFPDERNLGFGGQSQEPPGDDPPTRDPKDTSEAKPDQEPPTRPLNEEVALGASCVNQAQPGEWITAYFSAYPAAQKEHAEAQLQRQDDLAVAKLDLAFCQWKIGTLVTVRLLGKNLQIEAPVQEFLWQGKTQILAFDMEVNPAAPQIPTQLRFDVFVFGERISQIRLRLMIGSHSGQTRKTAFANPVKTAFASYSSRDRERVLDRVASLQIGAGIDVFLDCKSLRPGEDWEKRLKQEIVARDTFMLFWSQFAKVSKYVAWEWEQALMLKDDEHFQVHPLDPVDDAPPPEALGHLHFSDPLMIQRAYEVLKRQLAKEQSG